MVAYFKMLTYLIGIFLLFSLMMIPAIYTYLSYNGLEGLISYSKSKYSIGNFGFSETVC
jgi:hypothetical protein